MPETKDKERDTAEAAQEKPRARRKAAEKAEKPEKPALPEDPEELARYKSEKLDALVASLWENSHPKVHIDRPYI